jgi:YD repeat-containing protein
LTYGYDSLGRVTSEEDADSHTTTYTLDGDGNVLTTQIPGGNCAAGPPTGCITNTYDADSELKTVTYSDGTTPNVSNLTYDGDGRRLTMTDGTGTTTDGYDSLGRLTSDQNGAGVTVGYGYDLKDQLTAITYPGSHVVTYGYDIAGHLTTVADWLGNTTTYTPNANSFDTGVAFQNGVNVTQTPNDANQNMGIADKLGSTTLASMTYTRDGNNQVTGEADSGLTQVAQPFTYTPLNQVQAAGTPSYAYDAADNLTKLTSGTNQLFDAADELCWTSTSTGSSCGSPPSGATTYSYDSNGNRTASTTGSSVLSYGYDEANRLTSYTTATQTATYKYDGDGLRTSKTVNGTTTPFTWDTASSTPLLLSDGTTDYIYGLNGTPIEQEAAQPSISLIGETSGTGLTGTASITVNFPTGYQVGDEVYVATTQSDTTTVSAPSTYTLVTSVTSGGTFPKVGADVYRHAIASGESSVTISYSGTTSVKAVVLADYRGVDATHPVDVYSSSSTAGGTTVAAPSVSPAYANDRLLVFQGARGTFSSKSWTAPTGMTERLQVNSQANVSTGFADLALTSAGQREARRRRLARART